MVSRTPPKNVRELLRQEVNFGCPVPNCGTPYLMYHHFDPPWHVKEHHQPEGMIALCPTHAFNADGGSWTNDQLRRMKQEPSVSDKTKKQRYDYLRKDTVCLAGTITFRVANILTIDGERAIWFERDSEGLDRLNILIRDSKGQVILQMENNDWTVYTKEIFDLICPPQGKEIQIISKDKSTVFTIRFRDYSLFNFGGLMYESGYTSDTTMDILVAAKCDEYVPVWTMTGILLWGRNHLEIMPGRIRELNLNNTFSGISIMGFNSGVSVSNGMIFSIG